MEATHELEKRNASKAGFLRFLMIFGVPRGNRKSPKIEEMASENRSKKRKQKRRQWDTFVVRVDGHRAARGIQRFRSGRLLPSPESKSKTRQHSRRSAADSFRLREPRRPLRVKVSKIQIHIMDQHQNIMLRERSRKTLLMHSENLFGNDAFLLLNVVRGTVQYVFGKVLFNMCFERYHLIGTVLIGTAFERCSRPTNPASKT